MHRVFVSSSKQITENMQGKRELKPKTLDLSPVVHVFTSQPFFESISMLVNSNSSKWETRQYSTEKKL